jgi:uncharacterized membrane protein
METIKKTIEVRAPRSEVYSHWTRFEEYPEFMEGIEEVKQLDEKHLHWVAEIAGRRKEWDAEITEHVPDEHLAWRSINGAPNSGEVFFHSKDGGHTIITLELNYEPQGAAEIAADALGLLSRRIQSDLEHFRELIESRARRPGEEPTLERGYGTSGKSGLS